MTTLERLLLTKSMASFRLKNRSPEWWLVGLLILSAAVPLAQADLTHDYLERSKRLPSYSEPKDESLLRFEYDLDGDSIPEVFYSRDSLRDGKQGDLWTVYAKKAGESDYKEIGSTVFPGNMFSPVPVKEGTKQSGFYTYGTAGGGKGTIYFFSYTGGKLENVESKDIDLQDENKEDDKTFDELFGANLKQENPLNIVKTPVKQIENEIQNPPVPVKPLHSSAPTKNNLPTPSPVGRGASQRGNSETPEGPSGIWIITGLVVAAVTAFGWWFFRKRR